MIKKLVVACALVASVFATVSSPAESVCAAGGSTNPLRGTPAEAILGDAAFTTPAVCFPVP